MSKNAYQLTDRDKETISALTLEFVTELDLHYDDEDMHALASSFVVVKDAVALLQRCNAHMNPDISAVIGRFNRSRQ
ncbi:hypothetical protein ABGN05_27185 [Aquibium sp. LZ166]|uniref:Uncharacterized protein n=1 Tax=Aquibium pacificus TaxID=3153579 RepID=A0ABV3SRB4_9HYPH